MWDRRRSVDVRVGCIQSTYYSSEDRQGIPHRHLPSGLGQYQAYSERSTITTASKYSGLENVTIRTTRAARVAMPSLNDV